MHRGRLIVVRRLDAAGEFPRSADCPKWRGVVQRAVRQIWTGVRHYGAFMIESQSGDSLSVEECRLEAIATMALVVLGCGLLVASLLGGFLWALDDSYVGSGTGDIPVSDRLKAFLSQAVSNVALSALVLAAGVHLRIRMRRLGAGIDRYADPEQRAGGPRSPVEVVDGDRASDDMWRRPGR